MIEARSIFQRRDVPRLPTDARFQHYIAQQIERQKQAKEDGMRGWSAFTQKEGGDPRLFHLMTQDGNPFSMMDVVQFLSNNRTDLFTDAELRSSPESEKQNPIDEAFKLINHSVVATLREAQEMYVQDPDGWAALVRERVTERLKLDTWPVYMAVFVTGRGGYVDWIIGSIRDYIAKTKGEKVTIPYSIKELERQFREFKSWPERMARSLAFSESSAYGVFSISSETTPQQKVLLKEYEQAGVDSQLMQVATTIEERGKRMVESAEIVRQMFSLMFNEDYHKLAAEIEQKRYISEIVYKRKKKALQKKVDTVLAVVHRPDLRVWSKVYAQRLGAGEAFDAKLLAKLQKLIEEDYTERSLDVLGFRKSLEGVELLDFSTNRTIFLDLGGANGFELDYFNAETNTVASAAEIYVQLERQAERYRAQLRAAGTEMEPQEQAGLLERLRTAIAPPEPQEHEPANRKLRIRKLVDARKQAMFVWQELFNDHSKNRILRSKNRLRAFVEKYTTPDTTIDQIEEIVASIERMAKADFSISVDLGYPITKQVHDGECIAQLGLGSQTIFFETNQSDQLENLTGRQFADRLIEKPEKIEGARQHSYAVHLLFDGTDNLLVDAWLRKRVFGKLEDISIVVGQIEAARAATVFPAMKPLALGVDYSKVTSRTEPMARFRHETPQLHEVTDEADLPGKLVESPKELNRAFELLLKETLRTTLEQEKNRCAALVRSGKRKDLIDMLRYEYSVWTDRELTERFTAQFKGVWAAKLRELGDKPSYIVVEQQKEQLAIEVRARVSEKLNEEKRQKTSELNPVLKRIKRAQTILEGEQKAHQRVVDMINTAYMDEINAMQKWNAKIKEGTITPSETTNLITDLHAKTKEARGLITKLRSSDRISDDTANELFAAVGTDTESMSVQQYLDYLEQMVILRSKIEVEDTAYAAQALTGTLQADLPKIQAEIENLLTLNYGKTDVDENDPAYSPLLTTYKELNLGKINTAGTSGVGMLLWALIAGEVPAVRMLVDLKQSKEGGRLEYLTLSANEVMARRFNTFITELDTTGDVQVENVFDHWSELVQEIMIVAGFTYQLLVQHGKKGVSYTTTVTAGADKWRERALDMLTKAINPQLNFLYYVPTQLSFVHCDSDKGDANGFYSVPAPEKRVKVSVGMDFDHAKGREKVAVRQRIIPQPDDLQEVASALGYADYTKVTPEQQLEIQTACEGLLANRARDVYKWQIFAHSVTKLNAEIITAACTQWNEIDPKLRLQSGMSFLDFLMQKVTGMSPDKVSFSGSRVM